MQQLLITDLKADQQQAVNQAAAILHETFAVADYGFSWNTMEEALAEVREMTSSYHICRAMFDSSGSVIGWIGGLPEYDGHVWELHPLVVRQDHRGRGIGRALVLDLEKQVRQRGGLTISLGTDDHNQMTSLGGVDLYVDTWQKIANIRNLKRHPYEFYQKLGYTIIGVMPDANGPGKPDIYMAKRIQES